MTGSMLPRMDDPLPNSASCAIFSGASLLLIQRAYPPFQGYWTLPGGRMEPGETPEACVRREVTEELGICLGDLVPVMLSDGGGGYLLQVFAARLTAGVPTPNDEISDWCWADPADLGGFLVTPDFPAIIETAAASLAARESQ